MGKSEIWEDQAAMHIAKPFFPKRAFSFIYLAKTEGLWSRKVKTLSGSKAPPFYWEIWAQKPFFRKKGFAICIGFQSFLLRGKLWILENCKVFFDLFKMFEIIFELILIRNVLVANHWENACDMHRFSVVFIEGKIIAQHVKCDLARPWVRGALKKSSYKNWRKTAKKRVKKGKT